jgi:hypothetical protein
VAVVVAADSSNIDNQRRHCRRTPTGAGNNWRPYYFEISDSCAQLTGSQSCSRPFSILPAAGISLEKRAIRDQRKALPWRLK